MIKLHHIKLLYLYKIVFLLGLHAVRLPFNEISRFSLRSIFQAALPSLDPILTARSDKCEAFKSMFGITYEQMQGKNSTNFHELLDIDLIKKNEKIKYNLTATKQLKKSLENAKDIVVLIHGFMESSDGVMVQDIAPGYLKKPGVKVLALDGRKLINLEYFRSTTYVRFIGEKLGMFLSDVIKNGMDPRNIILIGHSLGAHIAGIAGKRVQQLTGLQLGRIAALDPAGVCFTNTTNTAGKLERTDAIYVDVIHSNAGKLGIQEPVGHKDFYPNGGTSNPGCYFSPCNHSRSWQFFAESVNASKNFPARKCQNFTMFQDGLCSKNEVAYMGVNSRAGSPGIYYLTTGSKSPYGLGNVGSG